MSRLSGGEFDITVGPEVAEWRKARKTGVLPTAAEIKHAKGLVGWQRVVLNDRDETVKLAKPGMRLDLGGIAKGYAGDEAQKVLKEHGITQAMVDIGDIVISDPPPGSGAGLSRFPMRVGERSSQNAALELRHLLIRRYGAVCRYRGRSLFACGRAAHRARANFAGSVHRYRAGRTDVRSALNLVHPREQGSAYGYDPGIPRHNELRAEARTLVSILAWC